MTSSAPRADTHARWRTVLETIATVCVIVVSCVVAAAFVQSLFRGPAAATRANGGATAPRPSPPLPATPVSLKGAALQGSPAARVGVLEASDYQCPYCGEFARQTLPALETQYVEPGKVRFAFLNLPLPMHPFAEKAAEAAECARRQGQFWAYHTLSFAHQDQLDEADLRARARAIHLDGQTFDACLGGQAAADVARDAAAARALGVTGTPTFLIGIVQRDGRLKVEQRLTGAQPVAAFQAVLDRLLKQVAPATR
jgi:protein-disulfide isomerase